MQDDIELNITEKKNPYNHLIYGLAIAFIFDSVLLFYPNVVSCGVAYWGEILLFLGVFVFVLLYRQYTTYVFMIVDSTIKIQLIK